MVNNIDMVFYVFITFTGYSLNGCQYFPLVLTILECGGRRKDSPSDVPSTTPLINGKYIKIMITSFLRDRVI